MGQGEWGRVDVHANKMGEMNSHTRIGRHKNVQSLSIN